MASFNTFKRWILGNPLTSHQEAHERLSISTGLAVFASDALSSTAYATEEILLALAATTFYAQANLLSLPIAVAIALLMAIVVLSYRQVIKAYPSGGGTYEVSKERLGELLSQVAGAALLIDYVLTVAVSVSAGVAAITSTGLVPVRLSMLLATLFVALITLLNLRGVKESGRVIAFPAYAFIATITLLIATGLWQVFTGHPPAMAGHTTASTQLTPVHWTEIAVMFALLKAFSHGCAALTGIEAISNGVKAFKEPSDINANKTMVLMGCILGGIFLGITYLAFQFHILPKVDETVISQLARGVFGGESVLYYAVQFLTMIILVLAANTSFSGFPRLATILAHDGFLPRQLMSLGDRLVFSNGILMLGVVSMFLIWLYGASTHALIPLYAVGVFLSFTLAQAGMVVLHQTEKEPGWREGLLINGLGALTTGIVTIILTFEKFTAGAWIVCLMIPLLIMLFRTIKAHYVSVGKQLALPPLEKYTPIQHHHTALVLVSSLHKGTIPALEYARQIGRDVEAVHIQLSPDATERLKQAWEAWGCGIPLTVLDSPYRSISQPLLTYIEEVEKRYDNDIVTIIVPEFVTKKWWHNLLHNQSALVIKALLHFQKNKVVTSVRYYLEE